MERVFLISDFSERIKKLTKRLQLPVENIISYQHNENESGYHNWLNKEFQSKKIDKIIIPLSILTDNTFNTDGLLLGLHIRLNYELPVKKRLIPIIFLSNFTVENLIKKSSFNPDNNPQNLFFTKGVYFSSLDIEDIKTTLETAEPCLECDYHKCVLAQLNIKRKETTGGHDIANAWGCFKLAQVIGIDRKIFELDPISKHLKQLYAKFLICKNESFSSEKRIDLEPIKCNGKNILFIDDKAEEGWAELMKNLFKGAGEKFVYVNSAKYKADDLHNSFKDFEGFKKECFSHIGKDWDLIIIDLRLNPEKEDIDNEMIAPDELSGVKMIREFLLRNPGYQIIVLTASNKIWNINAAVNAGAFSFYIKESPDFNYPLKETKKLLDGLKKDISNCFERSYLRKIFERNQDLKNAIDKMTYDDGFLKEIENQLEIAYSILSKARSQQQFAYAYVSLYMIIEIVNNYFVTKKSKDGEWELTSEKVPLLDWTYSENTKLYFNSGQTKFGEKPAEWQKFAGLYFQQWKGTDHNFVREIYFLIKKRNGFVHNNKEFLDKKSRDGSFENHDIFKPEGYIKLYDKIEAILGFIQ